MDNMDKMFRQLILKYELIPAKHPWFSNVAIELRKYARMLRDDMQNAPPRCIKSSGELFA